MNLFNINRPVPLFFYLLVMIIVPLIESRRFKIQGTLSFNSKAHDYKRIAKYCFIDDYPAWLQQQKEFLIWLDLAKMLRLPVHEDIHVQRELKQYRLQYECLRIVERLPVSVGPG
jgi:hypothetical protein